MSRRLLLVYVVTSLAVAFAAFMVRARVGTAFVGEQSLTAGTTISIYGHDDYVFDWTSVQLPDAEFADGHPYCIAVPRWGHRILVMYRELAKAANPVGTGRQGVYLEPGEVGSFRRDGRTWTFLSNQKACEDDPESNQIAIEAMAK